LAATIRMEEAARLRIAEAYGQAKELAVTGPLTMNDTNLLISAALDGAGLVCLLEDRVQDHLDSGRLVRVLEDWCAPFPGFFLYYPSRRQMPQALRALISYLQRDRRMLGPGIID
jgi:DNA-binding transcriptional LysR family regulator